MIKDFVEIITSVFVPSDKVFVGNNGAGQYLIFAESMDREQVTAALFQIGIVLNERAQERGYHMDVKNGFACGEEEQCFYIRELLSIAMKRAGDGHASDKEEKTVA